MLFKCKMCGGDLVLKEGSSLGTCEYCGSLQTVPNVDTEKKLTLFSRANRLRLQCEFDKAAGIYETIIADFPEEAEAYWGLVLCKYGIEYVDDPATAKKIPTCHRTSFESVMEDEDFEQTMENASPEALKLYREEAKQIEELRKCILEVSSRAEAYDIFICYKETDADGNRTIDSVLAEDIYTLLCERGYRVFFSRISLEDKLGVEYEPYIFAALNSAKVMLAIGTQYEYYNAVWVKNEWSRFLKLMSEDHQKHLIPCFKDIDAYDIPAEFSKLQAQDLGKVGANQDLLRGIDKLISPQKQSSASDKNASTAKLLDMGEEALSAGDWKLASSNFDLALTNDPENAEAYVGKLMAELKCKKREQLGKTKKRIHKNMYYKQAYKFAGDTLKQELDKYRKTSRARARLRAAVSVVCVIAAITSGVLLLNSYFDSIISSYHEGAISAEDAQARLEQIGWWYKTPDEYTQYAINKALGKSVEDVTSILIPDYITSIRDEMFADQNNIVTVTIGHGVTSIGKNAFSNCTSLESVTIGSSVTTIGESAFYRCTKLTGIVIPDSVTSIGNSAFHNCTSLESVTIPNSVTSISDGAFRGCAKLTGIVIPDSVTSIGANAFYSCSKLTGIVIPDSVTSISDEAFRGCAKLTGIVIPDSVTSIGANAFYDCKSLQSINIPDSVTSIGANAFYCCSKLTSIVIPDSVTSIGANAFYCCSKLTGIVIPDSVTSIGNCVFSGCKSLESVTIGRGISRIGSYAFSGCSSVKSINIPDSVTSIGNSAFNNCTSLESVTIGRGITSIGGSAFYKCNVTTVHFNGTKSEWNTSPLNTEFNTNYTVYCTDGNIME